MPASAAFPIDLSADERMDDGLLDRLRGDDLTLVVSVIGDRIATSDGTLAIASPADVGDATWAFLGRAPSGAGVLLAVLGDRDASAPAGEWSAFRDAAVSMSQPEVELGTSAVALGRWLADASFCPACGSATEQRMAGWARGCTQCRREHFPRTDPAVIVAVMSEDRQRLLLGANALWHGEMFSCFAGFVEAGESAESAIHRELVEEAGVRVRDVRYIESQAWPYPRSLMLGYHATVVDEAEVRPDGEEIVEARWFTREEIGRGLAGELDVRVPGGISVAHRLIRTWYDEAEDPAP
ncbi:MAG: NAD(+) diphosphatase [Microbacterium gubbeenense]|uniref:NAD(+) diphosphatase n=1 Tax=Microbacterium gubbeenense TaxID=159896 RepID=UPI00040A66EE|nr:NAD(+) diphosphatase [Microbacterium gubbeenense]